jgi:hypothetical protein
MGAKWVEEAFHAGEGFPAARTLKALGKVCPEASFGHWGGTLITQARSMAAGVFLASRADVWVSWDDDADVPALTLAMFIEAAHTARALVLAPTLTRGGNQPTFRLAGELPWDEGRIRSVGGSNVYPVSQGAFSLFAVHRDVVQRAAGGVPWCFDETRKLWYPALFVEWAAAPHWVSEDVGFCKRLASYPDCPIYAMIEAPISHAGDEVVLRRDGSLAAQASTVNRLTRLRHSDVTTEANPPKP